jgi:hypothetical protein
MRQTIDRTMSATIPPWKSLKKGTPWPLPVKGPANHCVCKQQNSVHGKTVAQAKERKIKPNQLSHLGQPQMFQQAQDGKMVAR